MKRQNEQSPPSYDALNTPGMIDTARRSELSPNFYNSSALVGYHQLTHLFFFVGVFIIINFEYRKK